MDQSCDTDQQAGGATLKHLHFTGYSKDIRTKEKRTMENQSITKNSGFKFHKHEGKWNISTLHHLNAESEPRPALWCEFDNLENAIFHMRRLWGHEGLVESPELKTFLDDISRTDYEDMRDSMDDFDKRLP